MTAQQFPDDIENIIYEILMKFTESNKSISVTEVFEVVTNDKQIEIKPQNIYNCLQRMCKEGMAEKMDENIYKGVAFDPSFTL
jgi:Fe2+ or Zn2+ uptake regulation protein